VQTQSSGNYPHQPHQGILEIIPRKRSIRKGRNGGWGGRGARGLKAQNGYFLGKYNYKYNITYLAPLTRARAPVSGLPLCLYISLHEKKACAAVHLIVVFMFYTYVVHDRTTAS